MIVKAPSEAELYRLYHDHYLPSRSGCPRLTFREFLLQARFTAWELNQLRRHEATA